MANSSTAKERLVPSFSCSSMQARKKCCWLSRRLLCRCRRHRANTPRWGAKRADTTKHKVAMSTITGPVGIRGTKELMKVPTTPDKPPKAAASSTILCRCSVQKRAATAGVMSIAAISTTPTACKPTITVSAISPISRASIQRAE